MRASALPNPWPLLLALAVVAALAIGWVGYTASDDSLYFAGAEHWLAGPFPGDNHWSTRFPLMWSFAAMLALLGRDFAAFAATALAWYAALVVLVGLFARRLGGTRAGWIAAVIVATLPVVVAQATTVSVDLIESAFLLGGAWLLGEAGVGRRAIARGAAAGLCFGLAILCRETSLLAVVALGPLFVIGKPVRREALLGAGLGLALVLGGEALFQWATMGDPLRRYTIAAHHDAHIDRAANGEGNFLLHPAIDPLLVLLVNDDFGLLFWCAGAAVALRRVRPALPAPLIVAAAMALTDFVLIGALVHKLVLNPRYFMLPAIVAAVVVALWLANASGRVRSIVLGAIVAVNLLMLSVGNAHPRWEMEALVAAAQAHPVEIVSGDPATARRAALSLRFAGQGAVRQGQAAPGGLELVRDGGDVPGRVIARYPSPPTRLGALITAVGLAPLVPVPLRHRLFAPSPTMVLVRR